MLILYIQAISTLGCFVLGFLVSIPVGLNRSRHHDHCLLYAHLETDGTEVTTQGSSGKNLLPGSRLTCDFCIFSGTISLIVALILLLATIYAILQNGFQNLYLARYIGDKEKKENKKPLIGAWIFFCTAAVMSLLTFVTACLISSGFHEFCEKGLEKIHKDLKSCDRLEKYVGSFYKELSVSQVSAWLAAISWIILTVTGRINVRKMRPKHANLRESNDYQQIESPTHL